MSQATDTKSGTQIELPANLTLTQIHNFFKVEKPYPVRAFREQWAELDDVAKHQIRSGLLDGSYTY